MITPRSNVILTSGRQGDEPMTAAQCSYLETLCRETGEEFDDTLTKAEASKRIDELPGPLAAAGSGVSGKLPAPRPRPPIDRLDRPAYKLRELLYVGLRDVRRRKQIGRLLLCTGRA